MIYAYTYSRTFSWINNAFVNEGLPTTETHLPQRTSNSKSVCLQLVYEPYADIISSMIL